MVEYGGVLFVDITTDNHNKNNQPMKIEFPEISDETLSQAVPWLVVLCAFLMPFGRSVEAPVIILALIGLYLLITTRDRLFEQDSVRIFSIFFACLWVPVVLSSPDSFRVSKSLTMAAASLRFYLAGLAIIFFVAKPKHVRQIQFGLCIVVAFWVIDAIIQYVFGYNLLGYARDPVRINGVFGERVRFGIYLSAFAPFILTLFLQRKNLWIAAISNLALVFVLLNAGSRAGWIMYAITVLALTVFLFRNDIRKLAAVLSGIGVTALVVGTIFYNVSPGFQQRLDKTLMVFKGDESSIDRALSTRLPIWKTAGKMIQQHPINGVGARAFRNAYLDYADKTDIFVKLGKKKNIGAYHAHQMQLEVLSETGTIGGLLLVVAMVLLWRFWRSKSRQQQLYLIPFALPVLAIFWPLNTHFALYSSAWAQVMFWFVALFFAVGSLSSSDIETQQDIV